MKVQVEYRKLICTQCGSVYYFSNDWCDRATQMGTAWKCPNGHGQCFGDSAEDKLRRERDRLKQDIARAEDQAREALERASIDAERARKAEAAAKRLTKRAAAGTCPCCKRTFRELSEHMKNQHPEFVTATGAKVVPIKRGKAALVSTG